MPDGKFLVATWRYFHVFWIFPIAGKIQWFIISDKRSEDIEIPYEKVQQLIPNETPKVNVWDRFGLLIVIGIAIAWSILGSLAGTLVGN